MPISSKHQYWCTKWKIHWNANTETASLAISLTVIAHMHRMLKTYKNNNISVSWIKNIFYNYVYRKQPSCLMEFKCDFHCMPNYTFKCMALYQLWLLNLKGVVILVHTSFLQLNDIESVTSQVMIDKTSNDFNLCHHKNFWHSTLIFYSRGFQPGVHLPICRVHILCICNKWNLRRKNGVYLYSFVLKIQWIFSILLRLLIIANFRGTCSSIQMLKGYMFRVRLGTPAV